MTIPFHDFGGAGSIIHFAHANAYPPGCYQQLFQPFLDNYKVIGMYQRPLWENSKPAQFKSWYQLADDLIFFFEQQQLKQVIGVGHSMGGVVSIIAAIKRPDLFSKLVLIDPVIFPKHYTLFTDLLPRFLRKQLIPIAKLSAKRRDIWPDQQTVFDSFRTKKVFRSFSDSTLWDFIKAGTKADGKGQVALTYPKAWETQIYITAPSLLADLKKLSIPILAIKGAYSNVITTTVWEEWKNAQPHNDFLEYPNSGHLVPMEYPSELAEWILGKLSEKKREEVIK